MRAEYKRDMNHNYLILYGEKEIDTSSYQVRMLVGNVLPSILKCRIQSLDGNLMFYYEITSRQSIADLYEQKKFKMKDLQLIFGSFIQVMEEMGEYLLNPGQLVLEPDYVFMDVEKKELYFCCLPGYEKEVQGQFRAFTEYILPKLDHEDGEAVRLGYNVYRSALEDSFHLEHIKKELYQISDEAISQLPAQNPEFDVCERKVPEAEKEKMYDDEKKGEIEAYKEEGEPEKKEGVKEKILLAIGCVSAAAIMLGAMTASMFGYFPWLNVELTMGIGLAVLGCSLVIYAVSRRKRAIEQQNWREEVQRNRKIREKQEAILGNTDSPKKGAEEKTDSSEKPIQQDLDHILRENYFGETMVLSANTMSGPASLVSKEPGELATIYLKEDMTIIGKLETACDAVVPVPTVSRIHAKIRRRGEEYYLTDLNSRNGTAVNGRMLKGDEEYCIQDEDEIDFAQARYVFLK